MLYVIELYNHINRAIRPSYGSRFNYSWMYVTGGLIMNIIGFCKIRKRAKVCEYVMYIVNGFIYIGAAVVLLIFHANVGSYYIVYARMRAESLKLSNLTCREELLNELNTQLGNPEVDDGGLMGRHEGDTFSDMIIALVIWLCILFLTLMNVLVAMIEIKRLKSSSNRNAVNGGDLLEILDRVVGSISNRNHPTAADLPPSYDETCPDQAGTANSSESAETADQRQEETVTVNNETGRLLDSESETEAQVPPVANSKNT